MSSLEEFIRPTIRKRHPKQDGWTIDAQKQLSSGLRIDYVAYKGSERAVYEAKNKGELTLGDVEQVAEYRGEYKAQEATIYTANRTKVPYKVRKHARDLNIRIYRTQF